MPWKASSARWHRHKIHVAKMLPSVWDDDLNGQTVSPSQEKSAASGAAKEAAQASERGQVCTKSLRWISEVLAVI